MHGMQRARTAVALVLAASCAAATLGGHAQAPPRKKLLFLTHAALYKHTSLAPAEKAVTELGARGGFDVTTLEGYKQETDKISVPRLCAAATTRRRGAAPSAEAARSTPRSAIATTSGPPTPSSARTSSAASGGFSDSKVRS